MEGTLSPEVKARFTRACDTSESHFTLTKIFDLLGRVTCALGFNAADLPRSDVPVRVEVWNGARFLSWFDGPFVRSVNPLW